MTHSKTQLPDGISQEILTQIGASFVTRDNRPALLLPTMRGYQARVVFLDGKHKKYRWDKDNEPHPPLFWCVPDSSKIAVITNGEKASLVLAQQGIACANVFGEGNELDRAIPAIKAAGVSHLLIVPDCDKAGIRAAQKWLDQGSQAGLDVVILDLGAYLKRVYAMEYHEYAKWDLRDLWLLLEQDSDIFKEVLYSLPHLNFEDYRDWLPQEQIREVFRPSYKPSPDSPDLLNLYQEWWNNEVLPHVAISAPHGRIHKHQQCRNPLHDDHNPSFRITEQNHPVCTCGKISYEDVALWFDAMAWQDYRKQHEPEKKHVDREVKKVVERRGRYDDLICLPDALRKALIRDKLVNMQRILDALLNERIPRNCALTMADIVDIMQDYSLGKSGVYSAMTIFSEKINALLYGEWTCSNSRNNSRGRPVAYYCLEKMLWVMEKHYAYSIHGTGDLLHNHAETLHSAKECKQYSVLKYFSDRVEITASQRKIAMEFNVSAGTISKYTRELRDQGLLEITPHYKRHTMSEDEIGNLSTTLENWRSSYSNCYVEMYISRDGVRYECVHKGGKSGIPSNRIPAIYSAVMHFFDENVKANKRKTGREFSNIVFVLVSKLSNSYRRIITPLQELVA